MHADRVAAVAGTGLLERPRTPGLDRLVRLAARLLSVPTVLVSMVTDDRQVFPSQVGLPARWAAAGETPLSHSFCQYVVADDAPLVITDARADDRVRGNRAIDEIGVIAYAGMPIRVGGYTLGSFCAIDGEARTWSADDLTILEDLAAAVASEIALIRAAEDAEDRAATIAAILQVSHDAYMSIDEDGRVLEWNPAAADLFGYPRAEAVGARMADLIVPAEQRERFALATGTGHRRELTAVDRAGRCFPVEASLQQTRVGDRPVYHAFLHDISARRDAAEQLRRQAELIDAAPAAIVVRDPDGTIRSWNHGAEQMYGWPAHAVLGRNIHQLLATGFPEGRAEVEQSLREHGVWHGELVHRRADGSTVVALSRHAVRATADGGTEVVETNTDITERRQAEEALAASERQFRVQFHQSTVGQAIVGLDGRIRHVNEAYAAMVGHPPGELHGRVNAELTHPDDRAEDTRMVAGLIAGDQESYERTKRLVHADGHLVGVRVGVRLVRDADGGPLHLIGVIQDVTGQLRAQQERDSALAALTEHNAELEQANLLKLDLMGMLSHDIGTPLTAIIGYGELLASEDLPPWARPPLDRMLKAARRINRLRLDVLSMCSLDAGTIVTQRQAVALVPALREALEAADAGVPVDCPPGLAVLANPAHLQQIIVNFLSNAAKYGGGATALTVRRSAGRVAVAVHDEGPGVPAAVRDRLFERYTRAADAPATGHGLGLHIVASLAEANGGSVSLRDNEPRGSVFVLNLAEATA